MKRIIIINGPNLNLLGKREIDIYGNEPFEDYFEKLENRFNDKVKLIYFQTNHEGYIIDKLQEVGFSYSGIVLNAAGYSHTSIAIADAITAITTPVVEVHISDIYNREEYRKHSYLTEKCAHFIGGQGLDGYRQAIDYLLEL